MQIVGHHLQVQAHGMPAGDAHKDSFARSAYNRYYYACFLCVRNALSEMNPDWLSLGHSAYPNLLKGQIQKTLKVERKKATRVPDFELVAKIDSASRAINKLAETMELAYATRVAADYRPDVSVTFSPNGRFSLNGVEITKAHDWESTISPLVASLLSAWRQIHV